MSTSRHSLRNRLAFTAIFALSAHSISVAQEARSESVKARMTSVGVASKDEAAIPPKLPDAEPPGKWTPAEKKGGKWKSALPPVELVEVIDDAIIPSAPSVETSPLLAADFGVAIPDPAPAMSLLGLEGVVFASAQEGATGPADLPPSLDAPPTLDAPPSLDSPPSLESPPALDQSGLSETPSSAPTQAESVGLQFGAGMAGVTDANITAPAEDISTQNLAIPSLPTSTAELAESSSSVNTRRTSAVNLDLRMRGYTSHQLVGTADGANQLKTRIDIDSLFSAIDPGLIQNMRVINGPYSSLYGPGFGFFIADTTETRRTTSGTDFGGGMILDQGTNGQPFYNRDSLWAAGENWGVAFSYGLRFANDYAPGGSNLDFRVPSSYQLWNTFFAFGLDISKTSRLEMSYLRNEINGLELAGVVYDLNNVNTDQFNVRYIIQEDRESPQKALLQYWNTRDDYNGDALRTSKQQTFYQRFITQNYSGLGEPVNTVVKGALETQGMRGLITLGESDTPQLTFGGDWRRYQQYHTERHFDANGNVLSVPLGFEAFGIPTSGFEDWGLFAESLLPWSEDFRSTVGGRIDWTQASLVIDGAYAGEPDLSPSPTFPGTNTPNSVLGMGFISNELRLTETLYVEQGVAFGMRNPTVSELYSNSTFVPLVRYGNSVAIGNSLLRPEKNLQFDLGLSNRGKIFSGGVRGFFSNIDDYILYDLTGVNQGAVNADAYTDPFVSRQYNYRNLSRASLYGGDAYAEIRLREGVATFGTVTYVRGINHDPRPLVGDPNKPAEPLPGIYPLNGSIGIRFFDQQQDRWGVTFLTRMVHGQDVVADSLAELPTAGYTTLDLLGYYRVNNRLRLTAAILNVTDRLYTQHGSLLLVNRVGDASFVKDPGINARFGLELSF